MLTESILAVWLATHLHPSEFLEPKWMQVGMALRYMMAEVPDGRAKTTDLVAAITSEPEDFYWAECGPTSEFFIEAMNVLGIQARRVDIYAVWNGVNYASHVLTEVYLDQRWMLYDPVYGMSFVNSDGYVKSGFTDIMAYPYAAWGTLPTDHPRAVVEAPLSYCNPNNLYCPAFNLSAASYDHNVTRLYWRAAGVHDFRHLGAPGPVNILVRDTTRVPVNLIRPYAYGGTVSIVQ